MIEMEIENRNRYDVTSIVMGRGKRAEYGGTHAMHARFWLLGGSMDGRDILIFQHVHSRRTLAGNDVSNIFVQKGPGDSLFEREGL